MRRGTAAWKYAKSQSAQRSSPISNGRKRTFIVSGKRSLSAAQVARIERIREIGGKASTEIAYIVTSPTAAGAGPERLLDLSRTHWAIENRLHYVRDVSFNEDRCRVRSGARALAAIRNLVLYLIRSRGMSAPEARENYREDRADAIALVTGRIL